MGRGHRHPARGSLRSRGRQLLLAGLVLGALLGAAVPGLRAQQPHGPGHGGGASPGHEPGAHRTPEGWRLAWPAGDPALGRDVFARLKCYSCHEVRGESFPAPSEQEGIGPELSVMGPLHEPEYFAEAVLNPSATIETGKGYAAGDGSSKMPSFNDSMTVQELIDLVAFLRSLRPPGAPAGHPGPVPPGGHQGH